MKQVVVSVDPGVVTLGFVIWDFKRWIRALGGKKPSLPIAAGVVSYSDSKFHGGQAYVGQSRRMVDRLEKAIRDYDVRQIHCEEMASFDSAKGRAAIGDVLHVAFFCGAVSRLAVEIGADFHSVPVKKWKGNLPKDIVCRRIRRTFPDDDLKEQVGMSDPERHDWDAFGIGLYSQGKF